MKNPARLLFASALAVLIAVALTGCGNSSPLGTGTNSGSFAYLQYDVPAAAGGVSSPTPGIIHGGKPAANTSQARAQVTPAGDCFASGTVAIASGDYDLHIFDTSTKTDTTLVTQCNFYDAQVSVDNTKLVAIAVDGITTDTGYNYPQVYVADVKLQTITRLTNDAFGHYSAAFSSDANTVVYNIFNFGAGTFGLYTIPAVGGTPTAFPPPPASPIPDGGFDAVFTPNGDDLVFTAYRSAIGDIAIYKAPFPAGTPVTQLTNPTNNPVLFDDYASVSPDGNTVTFTRAINNTDDKNIAVIPITGEPAAGATILTTTAPNLNNSFESEFLGDQIIFLTENSSSLPVNIYEMNATGGDLKELTDTTSGDYFDLGF